ncbi:hypothetical protein [Larsenimonas suaedae]|uniref:Uncharacterized protein n=1 Tax=Larsenimonas suaedae TaxID=1851019 RepID=A0ABU1GY73_9GAMM|nr:hypothetical protein [Larsenimonas suaedae]MCM2972885.1 hypothetical protein [Larsenimonas suaedae]MDR5896984.1 hypothetical protein [Larsenimonas suaedae]
MNDTIALRAAYHEARLRAPHWDSYRLAQALGVDEGRLMAARLDDTETLGEEVHGLSLTPCDLALALPRLGHLSISTRSQFATLTSHTKRMTVRGNDQSAVLSAHNGLAMRWLLPHWHWACLRRRFQGRFTEGWVLQVFDRFGTALHTLHGLDVQATGWSWLLDKTLDQAPTFVQRIDTPAQHLDRAQVLKTWPTVQHDDDYRALLERSGLTALELDRLLEGQYSRQCSPDDVARLVDQSVSDTRCAEFLLPTAAGVHRHTARLSHSSRTSTHWDLGSDDVRLTLDMTALASLWQIQGGMAGNDARIDAFDHEGALMASLRLSA